MSEKICLVTGASGLIGCQALSLLVERGFKVYALTSSSSVQKAQSGVIWRQANLLDPVQLEALVGDVRPSHLLHLAWQTTGTFNDNINFDFLSSSIFLLKRFAQYGGVRAVIAGTYVEYGHNNETLAEDMPCLSPLHIYGQCKNFLRGIAELYCKNNGVSLAWGRVFSAFGHERDPRRLTADIINTLSADKELVIKSGDLIRDYIYSKDAAGAFVALLDSPVEGVVNICTGKETSIREFVMTFARKMTKEHLVKFVSTTSNQQVRVVGNADKLKELVCFSPRYTLDAAADEILFEPAQ